MQFQSVQIDGFGTLADLRIDDLSSGLNVYYGPNGSGKTTILHFLRGVFCGFDEARRLHLLPPLNGGAPGGSLTLADDPSRFTVIRRGRADHADALAIQVRHGSPDDAQLLRTRIERLDRDLVRLLYFVGSSEAHSISGLVHLALRDGIELTTTCSDATWISSLTESLDVTRRALWEGPTASRLIGQQQTALDQATLLADQSERQQLARQEAVVEELQRTRMHLQRIEGAYAWLAAEIQPVESDLTECQTRLWSRRTRTVREVQQLAQPGEFLEAGWVRELHELDRQTEHAKQVLRDLAAARLRLTLESTNHACAETPDEAETLRLERELLSQLEQQLNRLQREGETHRTAHSRGACVCDSVLATFDQHLSELRQTVYVLCQQISRRQTVLSCQSWTQEQARIAQCETEVLERIRRLRSRREELLSASRNPLLSRVRHAVSHELLHCRCEQHAGFAARLPAETILIERPAKAVVTERFVEESEARPGDADLERSLLAKREDLRQQLIELQRRIRDARLRIEALLAEQRQLADDHTAMELRFAQRQAEERLTGTREQWTSLTLQQMVLSEAQRRLHREEHSRVIGDASASLYRLTQGRYTAFHFDPTIKELFIRNAEGQLLPPSALSRGTLDQTALSFRLALVAEYARRGIRLPLVLDDVLVDSDEHRLWAAVEVLREVAAAGQQIVFLTCQEHLSDLFDEHGLTVRTLNGGVRKAARLHSDRVVTPSRSTVEVVAVGPGTEGVVFRSTNERPFAERKAILDDASVPPVHIEYSQPLLHTAVHTTETIVSPLPRVVENSHDTDAAIRVRVQPEGPYWLRIDSSIGLLPSLGTQMIGRLGSLGVSNLGELILLDADTLGSELEALQISPAQLRLWQAEARLLSCVPDLTGPEAQLLAAIGIQNPVELGAEDAESLSRRISRAQVQGSESCQSWMADQINWPDADKLRNWIRNGRRAMTFRAASQWAGWRPRRLQDLEAGDWDRWTRVGNDRASTERKPREWAERDREARELADRSERTSRRRPRTEHTGEGLSLVSNSDNSETAAGSPRCYLLPDSPVVDAPSIGPKMAEKLSKLGVITVSDFLNRPAQWIADKLGDSKLSADTLRTWQSQSSLMCQVPGLRGHDAQLLVACDITTPEQILSYSPDRLLAIVGPLAESREGQRMLRSANAPDMEEIQDWIRWAQASRPRRSA
jgi:uncharacterized protein YhaN